RHNTDVRPRALLAASLQVVRGGEFRCAASEPLLTVAPCEAPQGAVPKRAAAARKARPCVALTRRHPVQGALRVRLAQPAKTDSTMGLRGVAMRREMPRAWNRPYQFRLPGRAPLEKADSSRE